jgi:hypothetical protein
LSTVPRDSPDEPKAVTQSFVQSDLQMEGDANAVLAELGEGFFRILSKSDLKLNTISTYYGRHSI